MAAAGTVLAFAPFVDWGKFLPNTLSNVAKRAKAELPDGTQANINTFPVNHSEVVIYPKSDDPVLNKEALGLGSLFDYLPSLAVTKMMFLLLEYTALCASTYGVYGGMSH